MLYPGADQYPGADNYPGGEPGLSVAPAGIAPTSAVGQPTVATATQQVQPTAIASASAVGSPTVANATAQVVTPTGIDSASAVGEPDVVLGLTILLVEPTGITSGSGVGSPTVANAAAQAITPDGIASASAVGSPALANAAPQVLLPSGIASASAVGEPVLRLVVIRDGFPGILRWEATSLHYPDQEATVLARLTDTSAGEVTIPEKDARTAKVTLSIYDHKVGELIDNLAALRDARGGQSAMAGIDAYATMLRCYYNGRLVFWGAITEPEWDGAAGTVTLHAVDASIRLQHHYLVLGDTGLSEGDAYFNTETDEGQLTTDYTGLRALRDAGLNTTEQTDRGVPDLGIIDGENDSELALVDGEFVTIAIRRGEEVWTKMKELAEADIAPDFELEPIDDVPGAYAQLNTYTRQGEDKTSALVWHYGFGRDNLAGFTWTPGGKIVTHAHKVSQDSNTRATRADIDSSAWRGIYVTFEGTEHNGDAAVLAEIAAREVEAYGKPPDFIKLTLPPDTERDVMAGRYRYLDDFGIGDTVHVEAKKGYMRTSGDARITQVTLRQPDATGIVAPELELVPSLPGDLTDEEP